MSAFDQTLRWFDQHNISLGTISATIGLLFAASILIIILNRLIRSWLRLLETRISLPYQTVLALTRVISGVMWLVTGMILLDIWGVGIGGIWTLLVSAATVVGVGFLATWAMVSNVTASFFVTLWRPFHLGDVVQILPENMKGRVIDRNMMFTTLREDDGSVIQIPNNLFFQKMFRVVNASDRFLYNEFGHREHERSRAEGPAK
jgi:small-conductance mechanosensitive channel